MRNAKRLAASLSRQDARYFLQASSAAWMATKVGLARLSHQNQGTNRVNPTGADKPGHDSHLKRRPEGHDRDRQDDGGDQPPPAPAGA
jgi:hypothetical protein